MFFTELLEKYRTNIVDAVVYVAAINYYGAHEFRQFQENAHAMLARFSK